MRFRSTRGRSPETDLAGALARGLAPDGGLYHPVTLPPFPPGFLTDLRASDPSPADTGAAVLRHLLAGPGGLDGDRVEAAVRDALDFPIPLVPLPLESGSANTPIHLLELFHGPTLAFKDVGARIMARLVALVEEGSMDDPGTTRPLTILTATSGDTGGAVASAFHGVPGTRVVVLFPRGQVSPRQEAQFTTLGGNTLALGVEGTFDDCQRMVKEAFRNQELQARHRLTSANSINVGRLLPQIVYHVHAWLQLPPSGGPVVISVPSGNFGNLTAGLMAKRMGLPITRFVAATNRNDVVPRYLQGRSYRPGPSHRTISSAMDVGDPSNFDRILALYHTSEEGDPADPARLRAELSADVWDPPGPMERPRRPLAGSTASRGWWWTPIPPWESWHSKTRFGIFPEPGGSAWPPPTPPNSPRWWSPFWDGHSLFRRRWLTAWTRPAPSSLSPPPWRHSGRSWGKTPDGDPSASSFHDLP